MKGLVSVIIVNWNNKDYLQRCINSILNQTYEVLEVIFIDNDSQDGSFDYVNKLYDDNIIAKINIKSNVGYSAGANCGIRLSKGEFVLIMNPDVVLEKDFILKCVNCINTSQSIAAISGKLLKYDFKNNEKLNIIDSTGILMYRNRRSVDRGQNEVDNGQYEVTERVFGVSGAAAFYRKSALEDIKFEEEYFDEDFFAYKEDVDLSWRLNLYGYKCIYYPRAIAFHGRTMSSCGNGVIDRINNRKSQSKFLRGISFRNKYLMIMKNETKNTFNRDKYIIYKDIIFFIAYSLIFERFNFKYIFQIIKLKKRYKFKHKAVIKYAANSNDEELKLLFE